MRTPGKEIKTTNTKSLEQELAQALATLKPFRLSKSWIRVPKKDAEIGVGGFGVVYRAVLQRWPFAPKVHVAVKKFHTIGEWDQLLRIALALVRELGVWANLEHPNILPLLGFHLSSKLEEAWLVSPYASNGNIFEYLERTQPGLDARLELAKDTAKGLEYLHTRNPPICHGDIKALNILIDAWGHAMLCDFGLAKATDGSGVETQGKSTNDGGTIRYWSPELFGDNSCPTLKSDVWAWGCLLLEVVTGLPPYHEILLEGRLIHVISEKTSPATLDDISCPPHVRDLLGLCWETEADLRPTMTQALSSLTAGNINFYRSESILPAPSVSSSHLDSMERELTDMLVPLEQHRVNPSWFEFPRFGSTIGIGGFGLVQRATMRQNWRSRGVVVAVKKLRAMGGKDKRLRMVTALIREVAVWATLSHPNVIPFIGFHLSPRLEEAWLVAPLMINGNLNQYLLGFRLDMVERLRLALDTAKGLQYLHHLNPPICHGDIKALNVLINADRRAVLCDFGLAKAMESMPSGLTTSTFNQAGSLPYESPELLLGTSLRALESDVWAWGCLLQEIFSGKTPYHWANNAGAIVKFITQDIPPAVAGEIECTSLVRRLLACCWRSRPDHRPSMGECVTILTDELSAPSGGRGGGNALHILQELEEKVGVISVENFAVRRSDLSFNETSKIGSGMFGSVYKGEMASATSEQRRVVAVKRLLPSVNRPDTPNEIARNMFSRLRVGNTSILSPLAYWVDPSTGGEILLIFPYVPTGNLESYLDRNDLNDNEKIPLATQIAEALLYLHTRTPAINHGCLHPRNILISATNLPLLSDYGFDEFASYFEESPATLGSLRYQSPETVTGASPSSPRGDVWSWGCILLLIMSKRAPYQDIDDTVSLHEQLEQEIHPARLDDLDCDPKAINLLGMCWTRDPASRPSMSDIVAILNGRSFKFARAWSVEIKDLLGLRFSVDGDILGLALRKSMKMYNVRTGELAYELAYPASGGSIRHLQFSSSGRLLAGIQSFLVVVWHLATREIRESRSFEPDHPSAVDISSDEAFCAVACGNGTVYIWNFSDNTATRSVPLRHECGTIAISPNCEAVAVGIRSKNVRILSVRSLDTLATFDCGWIWSVRFSPDGRSLFGACGDTRARRWDVSNILEKPEQGESTALEQEFTGDGSILSSVSGNSAWLVSISDGGGLRAVNLTTESGGGKTHEIGKIGATSLIYRMDLGPVSKEGTGYAVSHPDGAQDLVVWKYASLLHRDAHLF